MKPEDRKFIIEAVERILEKDVPNELKSELIYNNIIDVVVEDLKSQYEMLMYVDKNNVN